MTLLTIENGELRLNTNLDEYTFGKTAHDAILSQEGLLFDGKNFRLWTFEEVKSYDTEKDGSLQPLVFYCMKNPLSDKAKTLSEYFDEGGKASLEATKAVVNALTVAALNGNQIPFTGAGGIMVDGEQVLFAPQSLFTYSANTLTAEEKLNQHDGFLNETIYDLSALCFERASIVYRLLAGHLPYTKINSIERNADILDKNFLPLELCIDGIDRQLATAVNEALKLNSNSDLKPVAEFPLEKLDQAFELSQKQAKEGAGQDFEAKVAAYKKARQTKLSAKRNIKRNSTTILVCAVIALVIAIVTFRTIKDRGSDYTSIGLTSTQTIQAFMKGINDKNITLLSDFATGKAPKDFTDTVSRIYVMHKQRLAYGGDNGFGYPANWLFYITNDSKYAHSGVYGVTNLKIDGKPYESEIALQKRNENPLPLTKENDVSLENGSTSVHKVEYYLIFTEGDDNDNSFRVTKQTDFYTLTFKKNRWIITDIESSIQEIDVNSKTFKKDYFEALAANENDVMKAAESIRSKYPWLPETGALQREKDQIEYFLTHPYASLGF